MLDIGLSAAFLSLALTTFLFLPALHPAQLWCAAWAVSAGLNTIDILPYPERTTTTAVVALASTLAFCGGTLLVGGTERPVPQLRPLPSSLEARATRAATVLSAVVGMALLAFFAFEVTQAFGLRSFLVSTPAVRVAIGADFGAIGIKYLYFAMATASLASICAAAAHTQRSRRRWLAVAAGAAASAYFSTGRSNVLLIALVAAIAYLLFRRDVTRTQLLATGVLGLVAAAVLLIAGGQVIGKTYANSELAQLNSPFAVNPRVAPLGQPYQYLSEPFAALEYEVAATTTFGTAHGCAVFALVCRGLQAAGYGARPVPNIRPFTPPPLRWNTYTALDRPLLDGGFALFIPIWLLAGLAVGAVWNRARRGSIPAGGCYAIVATACLYSIGQFNFLAPHLVGGMVIVAGAYLGASAYLLPSGVPSRARVDPRPN